MTARNRHYRNSRQAKLRIRAGLAAAALVGGGAIAVTAVATGGHAAPTAAPAAYSARFASQGTMLSSALSTWGWSRQATYADLARLTAGYTQTPHRGQTLDLQRGIVVLATKNFLLIRSANGSLHLWLLSARTKFQNVSASTSGTAALTASTSATRQAMTVGNMLPATTLLAGQPDHRRRHADADHRPGDGQRAGGGHRPDRDGHGDQEHGHGVPDRDHAGHDHAGPGQGHVHPARVAGR